MRNKELNVKNAISLSNGIILFSDSHKHFGVIATIDSNDEIFTKWEHERELKERIKEDYKESDKSSMLRGSFVLLMILIIVFLFIINKGIIAMRIFLICSGINDFIQLFCFKMLRDESVCRFHAAEHMVVNALHKLGRIPSLEEVRNYSRFNKACGSNKMAFKIIVKIILLILTFIFKDHLIEIFMLLVIIPFLPCDLALLNWVQFFTTLPATDRELKVAIEAAKELEKYELKKI